MSTKIKPAQKKVKPDSPLNLSESELKYIPVSAIDFSPLNYRKFIPEKSLADFAAEITLHGIISPLTLRPMPSGRFELVAGERRLRAANLAGLKEVPATVKTLSDEEVIEIQLAENLHREDPHPMHEAQAIGHMQHTGKNIEEIAARLGKSKAFVYSRLKLLALIEPVQEMFLADKINTQEAYEIASVSEDSQREFYEYYCNDWKKDKHFKLNNLGYSLSQFTYDLTNATFNIKDKKLLPQAGACTQCPSNTATLKTLFPEFAKKAVCQNKECYHSKCTSHFGVQLANAFQEHQPVALIANGDPSDMLQKIIALLHEAENLPVYNRREITIINAPLTPNKDDYNNDWDVEEGEEAHFDAEGYNQALEEFNTEMDEYRMLIEQGKAFKGLLVSETTVKPVYFNLDKPRHQQVHNLETFTAKDVQAAIKAGTVTPELLQAEIDRIHLKEIRSQQIDQDKIQLTIHEQFNELSSELTVSQELTASDLVAARLIVYQSLGYNERHKVTANLFTGSEENSSLFEALARLTDQQYSYLIRMAVAGNSECKYPNNENGIALRSVAASAGVNIEAIEQEQFNKAAMRQERQKTRIAELEKKISKLKAAQ